MLTLFKKQIALPQDHGAWVFIFSPLLVGIFAGKTFSYPTFNLILAALAAFLIRQPLTVAVKAYSGRRPRTDLPAARFWMAAYGIIILLTVAELIIIGNGYMIYLAIPGVPVFAWHLWLISKRAERKQAGVEIIAIGVLSLAAPAAYWVGIGHYDPLGWWMWALTWMQSAASIVHAYLRLEQREQAGRSALSDQSKGARSEMWKMGRRALLYTSFNLAASLTLGLAAVLPGLIFIPFLAQWLETLWGITHPAIGWKPIRIGTRQLVVSVLWTILFIFFWRF